MSRTIALMVGVLSLTFAAAGCAVDNGPRAPDDTGEAPTSTAEALANNGGGLTGGHCQDGFCTCTGDDDCNDMYSGGECGADPGICQINDQGVPRCRCRAAASRVKVPFPPRGTVLVPPVRAEARSL